MCKRTLGGFFSILPNFCKYNRAINRIQASKVLSLKLPLFDLLYGVGEGQTSNIVGYRFSFKFCNFSEKLEAIVDRSSSVYEYYIRYKSFTTRKQE